MYDEVVKRQEFSLTKTLRSFVSTRNVVLATAFICAFVFWFVGRTSVSFLDDAFFNYGEIAAAPSPVDFFLPHSGFYKSWPLNATLIWLLIHAGLNSLTTVKLLIGVVHLLNTSLVRRLLKQQKSNFADELTLIYLFHPAMYLSLSWAWQIGTLTSLFFFLASVLSFKRNTVASDLAAAFLILISILIKPWSALFLPFYFIVSLVRVYRRERPRLFLIAVTTMLGLFIFKAASSGSFNAETFPFEQTALLEFKTGTSGITQDPSHPLPFSAQKERLDNVAPELNVLQRSLDISSSAIKYSLMAVGVHEPVISPRETQFRGLNALGLALIVGFLTLIGIALVRLKTDRESAERWLFSLAVLFLAWFPHSGIVYIPHFKFSYASPHYFAVMLPGFILCVDALTHEMKRVRFQFWFAGLIALAAIRQGQLYWNLNHDRETQAEACPLLVSPAFTCAASLSSLHAGEDKSDGASTRSK